MTQYNRLNVSNSSNLSHLQLNKLKYAMENETEVVLRLSSNMTGYFDDNETNFPHKLLLTNGQVASLRKAFVNNLSPNIMLSKTQLSKIEQSGGFFSRILVPFLKTF